MRTNVMIVDDASDIRLLMSDILTAEGYNVTALPDAGQAIEALKLNLYSCVIIDVWLENSPLDGLGLLEYMKKNYPSIPVIIMSGHSTIQMAVDAIKSGAQDYMEKPFSQERLSLTVKRIIDINKLSNENTNLRKKNVLILKMIGSSAPMLSMKAAIKKLTTNSSRVLILGPSGSGKNLAAKMIHKKSNKLYDPFITYQCINSKNGNIIQDLFGSTSQQLGAIPKIGQSGILFLHEITNLTPEAQLIILKFVQNIPIEGVLEKYFKYDIRIISSSKYNVEKLVKEGKFNADLYHRLSTNILEVPSLTKRKEDLPLLCDYFATQICEQYGLPLKKYSDDLIYKMQIREWSDNVRELKFLLEWMILHSSIDEEIDDREILTANNIPFDAVHTASLNQTNSSVNNNINHNNISCNTSINDYLLFMPLREAREMFEKNYLRAQMERFNGSVSKMSEFVEMERSALHRKMKTLGLTYKEEVTT